MDSSAGHAARKPNGYVRASLLKARLTCSGVAFLSTASVA